MILLILTIILFAIAVVALTFTAIYLRGEKETSKEVVYEKKDDDGVVVDSLTKEEFLYLRNETRASTYGYVQRETGKVTESYTGHGLKSFLILLLTPLVGIVLLFGMFTSVGPNEVGVVFDQLNGGIQEKVLPQGFHVKSVFQRIITINTSNETRTIEMFGQSSDGNSVNYEVSIVINVNGNDASGFYRRTNGKEISESQLNTFLLRSIQEVSSSYEVFDIVGGKLENVRSEVETQLRSILKEKYNLTLVSLTIGDVDVGPEIEAALRKKAEEKLKFEIAQQEKVRADIEAETALIRATNEASIIKLKAEANAEAQAILNSVAVNAINTMYSAQFIDNDAKLEFETNGVGGYLTIQEISDVVIKQLYFDVWDGKLPTVITDGNGGIIIQP